MSSSRDAIRAEITEAAKQLGLNDEALRELAVEEAEATYRWLEARFVSDPGRTWWWEAWSQPAESHRFDDGKAYTRLTLVAPDPDARVWFIPDSDGHHLPVVYDTSARTAQEVIGRCYGFEYLVASQDGTWLIAEDHHHYLMAVGDPLRGRIKDVAG